MMEPRNLLYNRLLYDRLVGLLFPPLCPTCMGQADFGSLCCASCLAAIHVWGPDVCESCGRLLPESLAIGLCASCLKRIRPVRTTRSLYRYEGTVRKAIVNWKFHGDDAALALLLQLAAPRLCQIFRPDDLLLPVPMPLSRMRQRGLHQTAALCQRIVAITGCRFEWQLLERVGEQPRQSELGRRERLRNLRHAFRLNPEITIGPARRIWVVDDVLTTGTTLRRAGQVAAKLKVPVGAFSLARTPEPTK